MGLNTLVVQPMIGVVPEFIDHFLSLSLLNHTSPYPWFAEFWSQVSVNYTDAFSGNSKTQCNVGKRHKKLGPAKLCVYFLKLCTLTNKCLKCNIFSRSVRHYVMY